MTTRVRSADGELLDLICYRRYGKAKFRGSVERTLELNYALSEQPVVLPAGIIIGLADPPAATAAPPLVKLWD